MENKKSSKQENTSKEPAVPNGEHQDAYIPDFHRIVADTRSKTCGITWKLHTLPEEEEREQ